MKPTSNSDLTRPPKAWLTGMLGLLGAAAVASSALDLSAFGMAHYLNSDFLTPYFFCSDLLSTHYPLSGWTLSASPYFIPDHLILTGLLASFGMVGLAYVLFTPIYYLTVSLLAGMCVRNVTGRRGQALIAGLLFGCGLLALRALPGHALCLWWIGAPCCHGGVLLLGFAYLWVLGSGLRRGSIGKMSIGLFILGLFGLLSDSLFLFQIVVPASIALWLGRRQGPGWMSAFRWQSAAGLAALSSAQMFKPICQALDWFYFSRILRTAPTPINQWHALERFVSDLPLLVRENWGFGLLWVAAALLLWQDRSKTKPLLPEGPAPNQVNDSLMAFYRYFSAVSLAITLPLPILSCGWKDANNVRYLFNWLMLPGFLLTVVLAARGQIPRKRTTIVTAALFLLSLGLAVFELRHATFDFPYSDDIAALDSLVQRRGLKYGLAQYWDAKDVTARSHAGIELRQIRASGEPYLWDNNAFAYYRRDADGKLSWPAYQYIIADRLDESALARVYGPPQAVENAGRYQVWIYGDEGQHRIREMLEPAVRGKLGARRLAAAGLN